MPSKKTTLFLIATLILSTICNASEDDYNYYAYDTKLRRDVPKFWSTLLLFCPSTEPERQRENWGSNAYVAEPWCAATSALASIGSAYALRNNPLDAAAASLTYLVSCISHVIPSNDLNKLDRVAAGSFIAYLGYKAVSIGKQALTVFQQPVTAIPILATVLTNGLDYYVAHNSEFPKTFRRKRKDSDKYIHAAWHISSCVASVNTLTALAQLAR